MGNNRSNRKRNYPPIKYDYIGTFHERRAIVVIKEKSGYIDITGKEVVPVIYILEAENIK